MLIRRSARAALAAILLFTGIAAASPFDPPVSYPMTYWVHGLSIGDVNGDGLADVAAAQGSLLLLLGNGSGFDGPQTIAHGSGGARYAAIEDVDGDGDRDLVVLIREGDAMIVVLRNQGDGSFGTPEPYGLPDVTHRMRIADVDRDGDPDALVMSGFIDGGILTVLRNDGSGAFTGVDAYVVATAGFFYTADIAVADVNLDGYPDVAGCVIGDVFTVMNDGTGGFLPRVVHDLGLQGGPKAVLLHDADRDGHPDLLVADTCGPEGDQLRVGLNDGDGGFTLAEVEPMTGVCHSVTNPTGLAVGYLDDDTTIDVAYASRSGDAVGVVRGLGDGTFEPSEMLPTDPDTLVVAVGDVNGDGSHDVVSGNGVTTAPDTVVVTTNAQCAPLLDQTLRAAVDGSGFFWSTSLPYLGVRGDFVTSQDIGAFVVDRQFSADASALLDAETPLAGSGFWYLVRPDCVTASWTSAGPSELPGRDSFLP